MKKTILTIIFAFILINVKAQAPNWAWAKSVGSSSNELGKSITTDASGNVYVSGSFNSPSISIGATILTCAGGLDMFIVKYDAVGNVMWAKSAGGTGSDLVRGISNDEIGNIYVTGGFDSDSITFGTTTLINEGDYDMYMVKYDTSGNVIWAKGAGSMSSDYGNNITTDVAGNVYLIGIFVSPSITFESITLNNAGGYDICVVKYDTFGNVIWVKGAGSYDNDFGSSITTDFSGNVFITGYYYSPNIEFGGTTLTNEGGYDMFVVKYDTSGNVIWAKGAGSTLNDSGSSITTDVFNNVYVTGWFNSFSITFGTTILNNAGFDDIFIVKYDSSGNVLWANREGSNGNDRSHSTTTDSLGNVFITGIFQSSSIAIGSTVLTNAGSDDIFILKYDTSGILIWAKGEGGTGLDSGQGIKTDIFGNIYITGYSESPFITFGATVLIISGYSDMFIAKLSNTLVGSEQNIANSRINFYPNPSNGIFTINSDDIKLQSCNILNVLGESVFSQNSNLTNQINLDLSAQAKGIYFVEVTDVNNNYYNKKVVVE